MYLSGFVAVYGGGLVLGAVEIATVSENTRTANGNYQRHAN